MSDLKKQLSLFGLTMIAIGSCIGAGIFMTPAQVASNLPSPFWILLVWAAGGLVALTGALTFAELGGMFPKAGGVYIFLKEAYGDFIAFLYGFAILLVITSGALAALAEGFAYYAKYLFELKPQEMKLIAVGTLVVLTIINILGVKIGELVIKLVTSAKLMGIAGVIFVGLIILLPDPHPISFSPSPAPNAILSSFFLAFIGVFFSYGGWHHATYLAAEVKDAQRNVPKAMISGVLVVTITYILTNLAYLWMLPVETIAGSEAVAADGLGKYFAVGGKIIAVLIMVSVFGTIAIYTMTAPRIYFAMARDRVFFKQLARVHPTFGTPVNAIVLQSSWAIVLLLFWDTFEDLITYVVFMDLIFMVLAAISIIIFRQTKKEADRPYRTVAYPVLPLIFIAVNAIFIVNTLIERPVQAWAGIIVVVVGLLFYLYFKSRK